MSQDRRIKERRKNIIKAGRRSGQERRLSIKNPGSLCWEQKNRKEKEKLKD